MTVNPRAVLFILIVTVIGWLILGGLGAGLGFVIAGMIVLAQG